MPALSRWQSINSGGDSPDALVTRCVPAYPLDVSRVVRGRGCHHRFTLGPPSSWCRTPCRRRGRPPPSAPGGRERSDLAQTRRTSRVPVRLGRRDRPDRPGRGRRARAPRWAGSSTGVRRRRRVSDGRVAFYMGDDTRFEDVYKFVTADRYAGQGVRWCARCLPAAPSGPGWSRRTPAGPPPRT
jgi:hypothetical protein